MEEFTRIPSERIAVLIGTNGKVKKEIETRTKTRIVVDSETGEIEISGTSRTSGIDFYKAVGIVTAIGRGFSPENAIKLLKEGYVLEILKIPEFAGKSEKAISAKRARVIGKKGTARSEIEHKTGCVISIYGKTIAIIGKDEKIGKAKKAVQMLVEGAKHSTAFDFLKREKRDSEKFEL